MLWTPLPYPNINWMKKISDLKYSTEKELPVGKC
jgi:hypothetical protein